MIKRIIEQGLGVSIGVPIVYKIHDIASTNMKMHGSYFAIDRKIILKSLKKDVKLTLLASAVAGIAFMTTTWVSRVSERKEPISNKIEDTQSEKSTSFSR